MGGITLEDFTLSVAYREIFGRGGLDITLRLLRLGCGGLSPDQDAQIRALPLPKLEALAIVAAGAGFGALCRQTPPATPDPRPGRLAVARTAAAAP